MGQTVRGGQLEGAEVYAPRAGFRGARRCWSRRVGQMNTRGTCSAPSLSQTSQTSRPTAVKFAIEVPWREAGQGCCQSMPVCFSQTLCSTTFAFAALNPAVFCPRQAGTGG
jgi:hypothetical protein